MKINPNGFREYDARWLFEKDIDLEGITDLGKGLGSQIIQHTKNNNPRVVVGHDYRSYSEDIKKALINPTYLDMNKIYSQQSRQILDLLVGFKVSPILWKNISGKRGLSAGRCQSSALRLVYDNYAYLGHSAFNKTCRDGRHKVRPARGMTDYPSMRMEKIGDRARNSTASRLLGSF